MIDRGARRRQRFATAMGRYYQLRGAHPTFVAEARATAAELPIAATRSTMRWAAALEGGSSMPRGFRPDRRLLSSEAKELAREVLRDRLAIEEDVQLRRHLAYLQRDLGPADPDLITFVRDTLDTRLAAFATSGPSGKSLAPAAGYEVLCILDDALRAAGHRPFLVSGTLLGVVREGGLLEHDYDLDLGLLPGDGDAASVGAVLEAVPGITVDVEEWRVWGKHSLGVDFDIFLHYEELDRYYHATRTHAWWNSPFELQALPLHERDFWAPADTATYLRENYGDWRSPTAFYHKSFDTPNREYCQSTEALMYLYELVTNATAAKKRDRFVAESAVRELARNFGIDLRHHFGSSSLLDDASDISKTLD
jgi:hypothetical protein